MPSGSCDDSRMTLRLRNPQRSAHASVAGYHYQFAYTALRWWQCKSGDVLYCEGNEDLDKVFKDGSVEEIQLKQRAAPVGPASRQLRETVSQFAEAFCEHDSNGRRCSLVFTTTARMRSSRSSALHSWLSGRRVDLDGVWRELVDSCDLPAPVLDYLTVDGRSKRFCESIRWNWGAPRLEKHRQNLLSKIAKDPRGDGLDPQTVASCMLDHVLKRSSQQQLSERVLTVLDLDLLLNDLWLKKRIDDFRPSSNAATAYLAAQQCARAGLVCVLIIFDEGAAASGQYTAAIERDRNMPGGPSPSVDLVALDGGTFLSTLGFDAYAVVDTASPTITVAQGLRELVPYIDARDVNLVSIVENSLTQEDLERSGAPASLTSRQALGDELGAQLAGEMARAILETWSKRQFNSVLRATHRKVRVVADVAARSYFTQSAPPQWASY
jgi:hypothetical protein